jgi:predicted nucleotidyltransferase component of viral defense system
VKFDAAYLQRISHETGFDAVNLEKVLRIKRLLIELHSHPFLKDRLVLKGGTALNLFYQDLLRLSVDIDLNYTGVLDREEMLRERVELARHIEQICRALNYRTQRGIDEHALIEWYLGYQSHIGTFNQIQVEVNFLMRTCALPPKVRAAAPMVDDAACAFSILAVEELLAGKLKAMIQRQHPRDLYDLYRFVGRGTAHDADLLRKLTVLFCSTLDRDFRTYGWARFGRINDEDVLSAPEGGRSSDGG